MKHLKYALVFSPVLAGMTGFGCEKEPPRTIYVMADATVTAEPQVAQVQLGVEDSAKDASETYRKVEERSQELKNLLMRLGVEERNIVTQSFYTDQRYQYNYWYWYEEGKFKGYTVHQSLSFKTSDFERVGEFIDSATAMKGVRLENVSFIVDSPEAFIADARVKALAAAREKAEALAAGSGLVLGLPVNINEYVINPGEYYDYYSYYYYNYYAGNLYADLATEQSKGMGGAGGPSTAQAPTGTLKGKIYVYVTYEARPAGARSPLRPVK